MKFQAKRSLAGADQRAYLCCASCSIRVRRSPAAPSHCPSCDRPLVLKRAEEAFGYRLIEIVDPMPLSPTAAAVAVALSSLRDRP
jgi:hypothetical protein